MQLYDGSKSKQSTLCGIQSEQWCTYICCKPEEMTRVVRDKEEKETGLGVSAVRVKICE